MKAYETYAPIAKNLLYLFRNLDKYDASITQGNVKGISLYSQRIADLVGSMSFNIGETSLRNSPHPHSPAIAQRLRTYYNTNQRTELTHLPLSLGESSLTPPEWESYMKKANDEICEILKTQQDKISYLRELSGKRPLVGVPKRLQILRGNERAVLNWTVNDLCSKVDETDSRLRNWLIKESSINYTSNSSENPQTNKVNYPPASWGASDYWLNDN